MKIAFLHSENEFTAQLFREIKTRLPQHELLSWEANEAAPVHDIELLIALGKVGPEQLANQPRLALIQTASTGFETVDIDAATKLGIWVSYAPSDITDNATSVAEFAVLLLLAASTHLGQFLKSASDASLHLPLLHRSLHSKTVCIVGLGGVGEKIVDRLRPFGMHIVATDEHPEHAPKDVTALAPDKLHQALADADYVVICVRAGKDNENLIDATMLAAMKRGAILINVARGTLIDEAALCAALESGQIAAAGLDVVRDEPLQSSNPLLAFSQNVITPHLAGFTDIMLHGTAVYVTRVVEEFAAGRKSQSILNTPETPRQSLHD